MKRMISLFMVFVCLFAFSIPANATAITTKYGYRVEDFDFFEEGIYYGSMTYWENKVESGEITPDDIPKAMLGDANLDGKVNAVDALFALNFAVYGNIQCLAFSIGATTPLTIRWEGILSDHLKAGTLEEYAKTSENLLTYCQYNSPFFANVNKDNAINAADALAILKYSVGDHTVFSTQDLSGLKHWFFYYPWPTEYYDGYRFGLGPVTVTPTDVA